MRRILRVLVVLSAGLCKLGVGHAAPSKPECNYSPGQAAFLRGALRAFVAKQVPEAARRALLANAFHESRWRVDKQSAASAPDSAKGGSHTAYQILLPNLEVAVQKLGWTIADVVPAKHVTALAAIELYGERQTLAALVWAATMGIQWSTYMDEAQTLNYFTRWAANSWTWSRALQVPAVARALRDGVPADAQVLRKVARILEAQGKLITSSALFKLANYRQLEQGWPCVI